MSAGNDQKAVLSYPGGELDLNVVQPTEGNPGLALGTMLAETGHVTLDPGFVNTASCSSAITYIDGDAGILRYRGYPIEQLAANSTFIEVSYLLIYGELPSAAELEAFTERLRRMFAPEGGAAGGGYGGARGGFRGESARRFPARGRPMCSTWSRRWRLRACSRALPSLWPCNWRGRR